MATKPTNHVTRGLAPALAGQQCPDVTEALVAWLEAQFPPKCFNPSHETEDQHHVYRGKVELVAMLRATVEFREGDDLQLDPYTMAADKA